MKRLIYLSLLLASCTKMSGHQTFTIRQGEHHSSPRTYAPVGNIHFEVYIDDSWFYEGDNHWNKLIGFAGSLDHHQNSVRVGWRCTDGQIQFALYAYTNGERTMVGMKERYGTGWVQGSVSKHGNLYMVRIEDELLTVYNTKSPKHALYPYFGGHDTAPHTMKFRFNFK